MPSATASVHSALNVIVDRRKNNDKSLAVLDRVFDELWL